MLLLLPILFPCLRELVQKPYDAAQEGEYRARLCKRSSPGIDSKESRDVTVRRLRVSQHGTAAAQVFKVTEYKYNVFEQQYEKV